ncbi:hypothetical protein BGZ74_008595 [Mortierella antarctica]|nr:hypothetical protein BGZ74_008595 [Mortierella antarctica]
MCTRSRDHPSRWLKASLSMCMAVALISSSSLAPVRASPMPQTIFNNRHHQSTVRIQSATILDVLGERPEFSKLLELIQKDQELTNLLADAGTQPTLFAPTNAAFDSVSDIDYPTRDVLMYHISSQAYNSSRLHGEALIKSMYDSPGLNNSPQFLRISLEEPSIPSTSVRNSLWGVEPEIWIPEFELVGEVIDAKGAGLYINRAKVVQPDLVAQSGGIVHGVNRIIRPPGETILDEVMRLRIHFTFLTKAWTETGVDVHVRDGKSLTLFAPSDNAWKALPKRLVKWLFSNKGRDHLKIFTMYQIGNRAIYTHDIFNKTLDDGTPAKKYREISLQTLLNSPEYQLKIQGKAKRSFLDEEEGQLPSLKPKGLTDLIGWKDLVHMNDGPIPLPTQPLPSPTDEVPPPIPESGHADHPNLPDQPGHYPHKNPNHPHHLRKHHKHRNYHKYFNHRHHEPHNSGNDDRKAPKHAIRRDEIFVNGKARVVHGHENWIAGNGVIHVTDKVLMPPRRKGCHMMSTLECSVWETLWDLASADHEDVMEDATEFFNDLTLFDDETEQGDSDDQDNFL